MNLTVTTAEGIAIALAALAAMEGVAYVAHRWVMHGFLWGLHRSHHAPRAGLARGQRLVRGDGGRSRDSC